MLVLGNPTCPSWGYRDHITALAAAKTEAWLLIPGRGYIFLCHSILSELLYGIFLSDMFCIFNIRSNSSCSLTTPVFHFVCK